MRDVNSLNRVILLGRLGQKPELRALPQTDNSLARFSLATNEKVFNRTTNESSDRTEWHKIVVWGKQAEFCEKYLDKGRQVLIEGKLRTRSWQDKDGNKRTTTEIEAQNVILVGSGPRREGDSDYGGGSGGRPQQRDTGTIADFPGEDDAAGSGSGEGEDEVPF
jgi:single-strand DNA-binding protein